MLFSATMPDPIITLARTFMNQPTHIRAEAPHSAAIHDTTEQFVYRAHALDKVELVSRILQAKGRGATMIFTRTKRTAQKVADELAERGFKVGAVHGDLGQAAREKSLKAFRTGDIDVLVATDVAARGIDIDDVTHVINYQIPEDEQAYVHRIGRTGRAGKTGIAVTLVDWDELARWEMIDKALGLGCPDPAETYSSSPHLYEELDIPTDAKGTVGEPRKAQAKRAPADKSAEQPARNRTRNRRRTRGGKSATGHPEATAEQTAARRGRRDRRRRGGIALRPAPSSPSPAQDRGRERRLAEVHLRRMVKPERRTKGDVVAAVAIAAVVAIVAALIWWTSDARATISRPAATPAPTLTPAKAVPGSLRQLWTAPSPKTTTPLVVAGSVVTGDGREVDGRDPATGDTRWSYARDLELCGVTYVYNYAVAVYPDVRGCGQVSTIDAKTGQRGPSRTAYADPEVTAVGRRHHRAVGRGQPPGDVALGHGPDAVLRLARRADQAGHARLADLPAGVGGGQLHGRVGTGGLSEAGRPAADAAAARRRRRHAQPEIRAAARRRRRLRRPRRRGVRHHDGRLRAHPEADGQHRRRDRHDRRQHAGAQAAVTERDDVAGR